jgi:hypothetical protein
MRGVMLMKNKSHTSRVIEKILSPVSGYSDYIDGDLSKEDQIVGYSELWMQTKIARQNLSKIGEPLIVCIEEFLVDANRYVVVAILGAISDINSAAGLQVAIPYCTNDNAAVRRAASEVLVKSDSIEAVDQMVQMIHDKDDLIQKRIVSALIHNGHYLKHPILLTMILNEELPRLDYDTAAEAVVGFHKQKIIDLSKQLNQLEVLDWNVRCKIYKYLHKTGEINIEKTIIPLLLNAEKPIVTCAKTLLINHVAEFRKQLLDLYDEKGKHHRRAIVLIFSNNSNPVCLPEMKLLLSKTRGVRLQEKLSKAIKRLESEG